MKMRKFLINLVALLTLFIFSSQLAMAEMMLFVGDGCPHCADVEEACEERGYYDLFNIEVYEIYNNQENRALYTEKKNELELSRSGVPFLVNGDEYKIGSTTIISYLEGLEGTVAAEEPVVEVLTEDFVAEPVADAEEGELIVIEEDETEEGADGEDVDDAEGENEGGVETLNSEESKELNGIVEEIKNGEDELEEDQKSEVVDKDKDEPKRSKTVTIIAIVVILAGVGIYLRVIGNARKGAKK